MNNTNHHFTILMADDDPDDYYLLKEALAEKEINGQLRLVSDGVELIDYLLLRGRFEKTDEAPKPQLILLDLNMPRMDGQQALMKIKAIDKIKEIPVVVYTTSRDDMDIKISYEAGAHSFITKPATFQGLLRVADNLKNFLMETVKLPGYEAL